MFFLTNTILYNDDLWIFGKAACNVIVTQKSNLLDLVSQVLICK